MKNDTKTPDEGQIEAYQWFEVSKYEAGVPRDVDYYRTPECDGPTRCKDCNELMHAHGWIDNSKGGQTVCPGDWIITGHNEKHACKPNIFATIFEEI